MRTVPRALVAAISVGLIPVATADAGVTQRPAPQIEQVSRADGLAGLSPLFPTPTPDAENSAISDDGRTAVMFLLAGDPSDGDELLPAGLSVRDVVLGRTTRLGDDTSVFSSMNATGTIVAFTTRAQLSPADTNDREDLYAWDRPTGRTTLLSRADGLRGEAIGLDGSGAIARGGLVAVFSSGGNVYRRNLLLGRTVKIGTGNFITREDVGGQLSHADDYLSADGRTVSTSRGLITPTGTVPLPEVRDYGFRTAIVSDDGSVVVDQSENDDFFTLSTLTRINPRTGARTPVPVSPLLEGRGGRIIRVLPDNRRVVLNTSTLDGSEPFARVTTIDVFTGEAVFVDAPVGEYSRNLDYAIAMPTTRYDKLVPRVLSVYGLNGATIPGRLEAPSPMASLLMEKACKPSADAPANYNLPRVRVALDQGPLPAASARIRAWNQEGELVKDEVVTPNTAPFTDGDAPAVDLPVGEQPFRLEATVRLADGRITRERQQFRGFTPSCWDYIVDPQ